jgi:antitoxin FitA
MPQLLVRNVDEKVVRKLKEQAGRHGVSMEEEHRRILRDALFGSAKTRPSLKEYLLQMPDIGSDELFERNQNTGRDVKL